jgi:hypothetical protein
LIYRRIDLNVPEDEQQALPNGSSAPSITEGYLARYAMMVSSAAEGAVLGPKVDYMVAKETIQEALKAGSPSS